MEILSAIIQLLGGLAMFLYGIELMGDGLKNSSGAALKRVLEKVTGNVVMGVLTGALVKGRSLKEATRLAVDFVCACSARTAAQQLPYREGVDFEPLLHLLVQPE